tara:strand:+ start:559 stop:1701 length:1143 start_codon:yes stop_codon:yes gene_type:complete
MEKVLKNTLFYILLLLLFFPFLVFIDFLVGFTLDIDSQEARSISLREIKPNSDFEFFGGAGYTNSAEYIENEKTRIRTDSNGFIIGSKDLTPLIDWNAKIIFFGGSTTENKLIQEDLRFPYLVGQKLDRIKVLNGGVSGNHSVHSLLNFIAKGIPENPNFIIIMHGLNDLGTLTKTQSYWSGQIPTRNILLGEDYLHDEYNFLFLVLRDIKNRFFPNLWATVRHLFKHKAELALLDEFSDVRYLTKEINFEFLKKDVLEKFTQSIQSIIDISFNFKITPILMTQPNRYTVEDDFTKSQYNRVKQPLTYEEFCDIYFALNDVIRKIAEDNEILMIDLDKQVQKNSSNMYDTVHLSTKGNQLVSNLIVDSLIKTYPDIFSRQ